MSMAQLSDAVIDAASGQTVPPTPRLPASDLWDVAALLGVLLLALAGWITYRPLGLAVLGTSMLTVALLASRPPRRSKAPAPQRPDKPALESVPPA